MYFWLKKQNENFRKEMKKRKIVISTLTELSALETLAFHIKIEPLDLKKPLALDITVRLNNTA